MAGLAEASSGGFFQLVSQFATKQSLPTPRHLVITGTLYAQRLRYKACGNRIFSLPSSFLRRSCETTRHCLSLSRSVSPSLFLSHPPDRSVYGEGFYLEYRRKDPLDRARNLAVRGRTCRRCSHRSRRGIDHRFLTTRFFLLDRIVDT